MTARLEFLEVWIPERMDPGTVYLLGKQAALGSGPAAYVAALACPRCATVGLITRPQLQHREPMICGNEGCSAEFVLAGDTITYRRPQ